jgi:hypothetical protein
MPRLKDRQRQIPGGFKFAIPEVSYTAAAFSSFDVIVNSVFKLTNANPGLAVEHNWPLDRNAVADWVDVFNAELCERMGWTEYYVQGGVQHKPSSSVPQEGWPMWAKAVAKLKQGGDGGVGDTVQRIVGSDNSDALKRWYLKTFGRVCGCDGRKDDWNRKYRYNFS